MFLESLMIAVVVGTIPALIAKNKGKNFVAWWVYGTLLFIAALPHSLIMKSDTASIEKEKIESGGKKCPFCAEIIKKEAVVCKHCGSKLNDDVTDNGDHLNNTKAQNKTELNWSEKKTRDECLQQLSLAGYEFVSEDVTDKGLKWTIKGKSGSSFEFFGLDELKEFSDIYNSKKSVA